MALPEDGVDAAMLTRLIRSAAVERVELIRTRDGWEAEAALPDGTFRLYTARGKPRRWSRADGALSALEGMGAPWVVVRFDGGAKR